MSSRRRPRLTSLSFRYAPPRRSGARTTIRDPVSEPLSPTRHPDLRRVRHRSRGIEHHRAARAPARHSTITHDARSPTHKNFSVQRPARYNRRSRRPTVPPKLQGCTAAIKEPLPCQDILAGCSCRPPDAEAMKLYKWIRRLAAVCCVATRKIDTTRPGSCKSVQVLHRTPRTVLPL